jgi:hypothetical protein
MAAIEQVHIEWPALFPSSRGISGTEVRCEA